MLFLPLGNRSQRFSNSIWIHTRNVFLIILVSPHIYHFCKWSEVHPLPSLLNRKKHVTIYQFFKLFWSELCWSIKFPKKEPRIKSNPQHSIQYSQYSSSCQKKITVFFLHKSIIKEYRLSVTRNFHRRTVLPSWKVTVMLISLWKWLSYSMFIKTSYYLHSIYTMFSIKHYLT